MGGAQSSCVSALQNPDFLSVVTLSDSAVQRLPFETDDTPLEKEQRNRNIDDYWRDRLECIDHTFAESRRMTEREFQRLEYAIKKMSPGSGKPNCPRVIEDTTTCYLVYSKEPLICENTVAKLKLCMDTLMQESTRKRYLSDKRKKKKPC